MSACKMGKIWIRSLDQGPWCFWAMVMQDGTSGSDWVHSLCTVSHNCLWICNYLKIKCLLKRKINCASWKGDQTKLSLELGLNHQRRLVSESQSWRHRRENNFWWTQLCARPYIAWEPFKGQMLVCIIDEEREAQSQQ